jgi:hypothetical protein
MDLESGNLTSGRIALSNQSMKGKLTQPKEIGRDVDTRQASVLPSSDLVDETLGIGVGFMRHGPGTVDLN